MNLSGDLIRKLRKKYTPSSMVDMKFKGKDIMFKTDDEGNPVQLFIGTMLPNGKIRGERFTRVLKKNQDGSLMKDHWDLKGKAD